MILTFMEFTFIKKIFLKENPYKNNFAFPVLKE